MCRALPCQSAFEGLLPLHDLQRYLDKYMFRVLESWDRIEPSRVRLENNASFAQHIVQEKDGTRA